MFHRTIRAPRGEAPLKTLGTIAVVVAGLFIVWPVVSGVIEIRRLTSAGKRIQSIWSEMRVSAQTRGQVHAFRFEPDTGRFVVQPLRREFDRLGPPTIEEILDIEGLDEPNDAEVPAEKENLNVHPVGDVESLSGGVTFVAMKEYADDRAAMVGGLPPLPPDMADAWERAVLFYPDGTSSTADIILRGQGGYTLNVKIDGTLGNVEIGEPQQMGQ